MKTFMISSFITLKMRAGGLAVGFVFILGLFSVGNSFGQQYVSGSGSSVNNPFGAPNSIDASVTSAGNVTGAPDANFATLRAAGITVNLLVDVTYASAASLTVTFPNAISATKKAYIRIDQPTVEGISLNLSSLVNLLGLLSNNTIRVVTNAGTAQTTFVKDASNNLYLAVSSSSNFTSATITLDFANSAGNLVGFGLGAINLKVYDGVTYENSTFTPCDAVPFSFAGVDPSAVGVSVTLDQALTDPQKALDGIVSIANFAVLQNGTVGVVSTVSENVYLGKTVSSTNQVVAVISKPGSLVDLGVLNNITLQAYLGSATVGPARSVSSLLSVDLLGLFTSNALVTVSYSPGGSYDRVELKSSTTTGVPVFAGLNIHEIGSRPPVSFTGGKVPGVSAGNPLSSPIASAAATALPIVLPGFSIACGVSTDYTYKLFEVTFARTMAGTLPSTLSLTSAGTLVGTPTLGQQGTYTFDVEATNSLGQKQVAPFVVVIENPLPVVLASFKASKEGQAAQLAWATTSESNSESFDVERSGNGKEWLKIGNRLAKGESAAIQAYSYVDNTPLEGENLYRLKMIDRDGTFAFSKIENLTFNLDGSFKLYPNPVANSENLHLEIVDLSKVRAVLVVSASGKTIFESSNITSSEINTGHFTSGLYLVKVIQKDGKINVHKFVKL